MYEWGWLRDRHVWMGVATSGRVPSAATSISEWQLTRNFILTHSLGVPSCSEAGNHQKIIRNNIGIYSAIFEPFVWWIYRNNTMKSSVILFCFNLNLYLFDLLMGEPKNPHFYNFGIFERVPGPQNQLFLSLETPWYLNTIKKQSEIIWTNPIFIHLKNG